MTFFRRKICKDGKHISACHMFRKGVVAYTKNTKGNLDIVYRCFQI